MMETRLFVLFIIPPMDLLVRQRVGCQWAIQSRPKWRDGEQGLDQENAEKGPRGRTWRSAQLRWYGPFCKLRKLDIGGPDQSGTNGIIRWSSNNGWRGTFYRRYLAAFIARVCREAVWRGRHSRH